MGRKYSTYRDEQEEGGAAGKESGGVAGSAS